MERYLERRNAIDSARATFQVSSGASDPITHEEGPHVPQRVQPGRQIVNNADGEPCR
jgi:hypothetical protein